MDMPWGPTARAAEIAKNPSPQPISTKVMPGFSPGFGENRLRVLPLAPLGFVMVFTMCMHRMKTVAIYD